MSRSEHEKWNHTTVFTFFFSILTEILQDHRALGTSGKKKKKKKKTPANAGDTRDVGLIPGSEDPLEEDMATHSSIFAWRISQTEEPGRLQSIGSQRVEHD